MSKDVQYALELDTEECRSLLATTQVGRVAWQAAEGLIVLPVNYHLVNGTVVFHTSRNSPLAQLLEPTEVAFQIDSIVAEDRVGWSVCSRATSGPSASTERQSWMPDGRELGVALDIYWLNGRVVSGTQEGSDND